MRISPEIEQNSILFVLLNAVASCFLLRFTENKKNEQQSQQKNCLHNIELNEASCFPPRKTHTHTYSEAMTVFVMSFHSLRAKVKVNERFSIFLAISIFLVKVALVKLLVLLANTIIIELSLDFSFYCMEDCDVALHTMFPCILPCCHLYCNHKKEVVEDKKVKSVVIKRKIKLYSFKTKGKYDSDTINMDSFFSLFAVRTAVARQHQLFLISIT